MINKKTKKCIKCGKEMPKGDYHLMCARCRWINRVKLKFWRWKNEF